MYLFTGLVLMVFALYIQDRRIFHGELTTQNRNSYFQPKFKHGMPLFTDSSRFVLLNTAIILIVI